jgi:hypothetical protein
LGLSLVGPDDVDPVCSITPHYGSGCLIFGAQNPSPIRCAPNAADRHPGGQRAGTNVLDAEGSLVGWDESAVHVYEAANGMSTPCDAACGADGYTYL